jgi:hypothetical protein
MTTKDDIERLIETCAMVERSVIELSKGIAEFESLVSKQPIFVKPVVKRDFASTTGMNVEEWKRFAGRLHTRFTSIDDDAKKVLETYERQGSESDMHAAIATLKDTTTPFMESADVAIKTIEGLATYLEGLPKKLEIVPTQILKEEEKNKMIEMIPENVEKVKGLANLLKTIKDQVTDIIAR